LVIICLSVLEYQIEFKKEDRNLNFDKVLLGPVFTLLLICTVTLGVFNVLHSVVYFKFTRLRKSLIGREHRISLDYIAKKIIETLVLTIMPLKSLYESDKTIVFHNTFIN